VRFSNAPIHVLSKIASPHDVIVARISAGDIGALIDQFVQLCKIANTRSMEIALLAVRMMAVAITN
jgi:hypothetical protein